MTPPDTLEPPDLRSRVVALEHSAAAREQRLMNIELWRNQQDVFNARRDEQFKHLDERFDNLDKKITALNDTLTWITRLVLGAIVLAVVAFMVRGGFNLPN